MIGSALLLLLLSSLALFHGLNQVIALPRVPVVLEAGYGWWVATVFTLAQIGIGRAWARTRWLGRRRLEGLGDVATAAAIGLATTSTILLVVGLLGGLDREGALVVSTILLAFAISTVAARRRPQSAASRRWAWRCALRALVVIVLATPYFVQTLLPDSDWDSALYHLPLAERLLDGALWTQDLPLHAYYRPASIHLIYAYFERIGGEAAITPLNAIAVLLVLAATAGLARAIGGRRAAGIAVAIVVSANLLLELGLDARVDPFLVLFSAVGALALVRSIRRPARAGYLLVVAIAAGGAIGAKYNGLAIAASLLAVSSIFWFLRSPLPAGRQILLVALALPLVLVPSGFWYVRNQVLMNDAVYPFTNGALFRDASGHLVPFSGRMRRVPPHARSAAATQEYVGEIKDDRGDRKNAKPSAGLLVDAVTNPERYDSKPLHRVSPFFLLFIVLPFAIRTAPAIALAASVLAAYAVLALRSPEIRYLAPIFPALAAGAGAVLVRFPRGWIHAPVVLGLAGLIGMNAWAEFEKARELDPAAYLSGREDRIEYLARVGYNGEVHMPRLAKWLNAQIDAGRVPPDARVYMLAEAKGHLLRCPYTPALSNSFVEFFVELKNHKFRRGKLAQSLIDRGYWFVLVNRGWVVWNLRNSAVNRPVLQTAMHHLDLFLAKHCGLVVRQGDISLYRMRAKP